MYKYYMKYVAAAACTVYTFCDKCGCIQHAVALRNEMHS